MVPPPPTWVYDADFREFTYSGSLDIIAEVVFVGYGLTMPASFPIAPGYDDYAGIDVTGKIVLVLRYGPNNDWSWSIPMPSLPFSAFYFGYKAYNAYMHGAVGMILVNNYNDPPEAAYGTLTEDGYIPTFGALWAHRTTVGEALVPGLAARQASIDSTLTPASGPTGMTVHMVVKGTCIVDIDIKPGSSPNRINLKSKGKVPVAVLTTDDFDATTVDPDTVLFAGATPLRWAIEDVDYDGDMDLLFHFKTQELLLFLGYYEVSLEGYTFDGTWITGADSVNIVQPKEP